LAARNQVGIGSITPLQAKQGSVFSVSAAEALPAKVDHMISLAFASKRCSMK
jgi:hypothetical protein